MQPLRGTGRGSGTEGRSNVCLTCSEVDSAVEGIQIRLQRTFVGPKPVTTRSGRCSDVFLHLCAELGWAGLSICTAAPLAKIQIR